MCGIRGEKHAGDGLSKQEHTPSSRYVDFPEANLKEGQKQGAQTASLPLRARDMEVLKWGREQKRLADEAEAASKNDGKGDDSIPPFSMPELDEVKSGNITTPSNVRRAWKKGDRLMPREFFSPVSHSAVAY